jgi:hypothetical protein
MGDKLMTHWAKNEIDKEFLAYYFPYLAKENFKKLDPNAPMMEHDFIISLASLLKDYGYNISSIGLNESISRRDMVSILGEKLTETETILLENVELPFKDINTMNKDEIKLLMGLYKSGIIQGNSNAKFDPDRKLSQAEAIIILQRVKGVLDKMKVISYNTLGIVQTYNSQEELIIKENDDKVLLTITKEFPTPGYSMSVDKIVRSPGGYKVLLNITPPKEGLIQMQVITYKTLTLEIDKDKLGNSPYNFSVEDEKLLAFRGRAAWQR